MYHSISDGAGPTCIPPEAFRRQMDLLEQSGSVVVSLGELGRWIDESRALPGRSAVLTFDDGFADFATAAFPELERRGWPATVFLPVGHVGRTDGWDSGQHGRKPRSLLDWPAVADLAAAGIEFGGHGVTHRDLTQLSGDELSDEIARPKTMIEERLSRLVESFAAPYGRTAPAVDSLVRRHYRQAVSTELALAGPRSDHYAIPRIEMWYFRDPSRFDALLRGKAGSFLRFRRVLRRCRAFRGVPGCPTEPTNGRQPSKLYENAPRSALAVGSDQPAAPPIPTPAFELRARSRANP
jgi:peptidoglycan/xylan/chitin deacetylase (PgdA/CDA1 family)